MLSSWRRAETPSSLLRRTVKISSLVVVKHLDAAVINLVEKAWPWRTWDPGFGAGFDGVRRAGC